MALIGMTKAAEIANTSRTTIRKDLDAAGLLVKGSTNAFLVEEEGLRQFLQGHGEYRRGRPRKKKESEAS